MTNLMVHRGFGIALIISITLLIGTGTSYSQTILFQEDFENSSLASRGWYDNTTPVLSTIEHVTGSSSSLEFRWLPGATTPISGASMRRKFAESDSVYIRYYVKYSANYTGSNRAYHPHEFYVLTNLNPDYSGLAYTNLTAYVEQNEGTPQLAIQDGKNIDESRIGVNLVGVTENRAVAGCNGSGDSYGDGLCYTVGSAHWNNKIWKANGVYFRDTTGPYYKGDWHLVEAYFKLNSIVNGRGIADGQIKYWYDGVLLIDHSDVMLRTGQYPTMKFNQFVIGPYIGDGSPVDQSFWVDDLVVATGRTGSGTSAPAPPRNLRVQ